MKSPPSKRLIPVELLRRSTRRQGQTTGAVPDGNLVNNEVHSKEPMVKIKKERQTRKRAVVEPVAPDVIAAVLKMEQMYTLIKTKQEAFAVEKNLVCEVKPDGYLLVDEQELDLERTLLGGQSFRWTKIDYSVDGDQRQTIFTGTIGSNVFQLWRCDSQRIAYKLLNIEAIVDESDIETLLKDYFQLKYKLSDLYEQWSEKDDNFRKCSQNYRGFRILRQDPVENVFSFICATNNNIKRISLMVCGLCCRFGKPLVPNETTKVTPSIEDKFYTFPTVERLAQDDVFNELRYELGFGYRAKFICETAKNLVSMSSSHKVDGPRNYLMSLRQAPYKETCKQLQTFPGIGRKVADCICLMSMDHLDSVPIDCHIYEIVCRDYMKTLREERKTVTEKVHDLIGDYFVDLFGPLAGWATSVLFVGELKHLKVQDPKDGPKNKANKKIKT
uniref:DNA-(apurinic or apyrimidinic site) lyase n=1 Tax=Aceria tosichella TaxID=561515 RepID=A0A6G1SB67_9ACAR